MMLADWRSRALVAVIVLQFAVPLTALVASEPPTRFGFQMYSGLGGSTVEIHDANGELVPYDWRNAIASLPRADLDWGGSRLPAHLCDEVPEAATVTVRRGDGERVVPCD